MTPGTLTASERRAETVTSLFKTVHPHQAPDPTLRFRGDLGLVPSRRVRLADIAARMAAYVLPEPIPPARPEIARWDVADDGIEVTHAALDAAGRTVGVVVRGEDGRYRYSVRGVRLGHAGGVNALSAAKVALGKAMRRTA